MEVTAIWQQQQRMACGAYVVKCSCMHVCE